MADLDAMLQQQIQHAYENAPAVRQIMDDAGVSPDDILSVHDLVRIPVTSKDRLLEMQQQNPPFGGFLAVPLKNLRRIYLSPGPIYDPHGFGDEAVEEAAIETFTEAGFTENDIVLNTFMYHMVPAGLLMDAAMAHVGATVIPLGPGNIELQIKVMFDLKVTAYVGTPSFLEMIYDKAAEMGIPAEAFPLQKAFFSAEMYTRSQRDRFEGQYGLLTSQAYATADLGILAYERPGRTGLYIPHNLIIQVCDPQTGVVLEHGQVGEVVITTMNTSYPLIRFGTGDLSIMEIEIDEDGIEHRKLQGLLGRSGEAVKVRGMFLHPSALKQALADFDNIERFQAVVDREGTRDMVTLELLLSGGSVDPDLIVSAVREAARLSINEVKVVDSIEGSRLVRDIRIFE